MRQLMILEVSQKQAYIFESTRLSDNVERSEEICWVTDPDYFKAVAKQSGLAFDKEKNLVYSGGGHTVLEFEDRESAKKFAYAVSSRVRREFPELEYFIKIMEYKNGPDDDPGSNLSELSKQLEKKKSVRAASFHQGTFGVEENETNLRRPKPDVPVPDRIARKKENEYVPAGYVMPKKLEDLGVSKDDSSFIAVIHIDGNGMGKRVQNLRSSIEKAEWNEYKKTLKNFSDAIDSDFKMAFRGMLDEIADQIGDLKDKGLKLEEHVFPVRKLILAGDDVCFVTEGRIGLEAARIFIEKLSELENAVDHRKYTACAGVAIVHQKYPFYKAYELSEMLCSNSKRFLAALDPSDENAGTKGCAIDWHIEFGEIIDDLSDMRQKYETSDGGTLELRPYLIRADKDLWDKEKLRRYSAFKRLVTLLQNKQETFSEDKNEESRKQEIYARGKIKELRGVLKEGEKATEYYMQSSLMDPLDFDIFEDRDQKKQLDSIGTGRGLERRTFQEINGKKHSLYFDAIEILDTFISLDGKGAQS
nr:hypothetical protein [Clostridium sp. Marseille-P7770]